MSKQRPPLQENPDYEPRAASNVGIFVAIGVAMVLVVLVVVWFVWQQNKSYPDVKPQVLEQNTTFVLGAESAPATIDIFEDFDCPHCKEFSAESGEALKTAASTGKLRVRYHLLTFMDEESPSGSYSSRGAGAMRCAAQSGDSVTSALHEALFAAAPGKKQTDPDEAGIAEMARKAGAPQQVIDCISGEKMVDDARGRADKSKDELYNALEGEVATPTALHDGEKIDDISGTDWISKIPADAPAASKAGSSSAVPSSGGR